jgi:hypothetical protein
MEDKLVGAPGGVAFSYLVIIKSMKHTRRKERASLEKSERERETKISKITPGGHRLRCWRGVVNRT